jgi:hypothetical protein
VETQEIGLVFLMPDLSAGSKNNLRSGEFCGEDPLPLLKVILLLSPSKILGSVAVGSEISLFLSKMISS